MSSSRQEPQPGDLIEIFRIGYQHWAIYVGDGYVIHLAPPNEYPGAGSSSIFSVLTDMAEVKWERLEDVVGNCNYRINNSLDREYIPRRVEVIIEAAKSQVGEKLKYNLVRRNCEHFVTDLRYGKPRSKQVDKAKIGAGVTTALGVLGLFGYAVVRSRRQNQ
ncbi:retinoic acid receptor responder protein 3 isoform X1 [Carlito syrichta]|uniref:Retinoic acid receptor responder protein 3 isoform X1 n=1 Tax=Carlito syrichta TaxID=1868482 RepID=A0A1U7UCV1_CARSF|nr:retinoic acid receptor responder protein 3 isoform X1 [Carlito syrichta]